MFLSLSLRYDFQVHQRHMFFNAGTKDFFLPFERHLKIHTRERVKRANKSSTTAGAHYSCLLIIM